MPSHRSCAVKLVRVTQRVFTGKPQGIRALESGEASQFRDYLLESDQFSALAVNMIADVPFDAEAFTTEILASRDFVQRSDADKELLAKMLRNINAANIAREVAWEHAGTKVTEEAHGKLLKKLWVSLTGEKKVGDWSRLGFQNKQTPYTDFRSEGLLALHCLLTAREHLGEKVSDILTRSEVFGLATLSVNVTSWVRALLMDKKHRLIDPLFYFDESELDRTPHSICLGIFAWLHWRVLEAFLDFWETYGYPSILSFGPVSDEFRGGLAKVVNTLCPPSECYEGSTDYSI